LRPGLTLSPADEGRIYAELLQALFRVQSEFRTKWENIYRFLDSDPARRILQLRWRPWPELSRDLETRPKRVSIET
jgi:hypothetical protein